MDISVTVLISVVAALLGIFFGYKGHERSQRGESRDEGKQFGIILTEVGYIKSGVDDIKRKSERQDAQHLEVISRLTTVEASSKQAHKRIDRIDDLLKLDRRNPTD